MKLKILELASFEIEDAKQYYNLQQTELGDRFKKDVKKCIDSIILSPTLYPQADDNVRRCLLHRFPYSIFYAIDDETIVILSVAHQRRKPYYWVG